MQITIVQAEMEAAIRNYIQTLIAIQPGMRVDIDIKQTRGETGMSAVIDIVPENAPASVTTPAPAPAAAPRTRTVAPSRAAAPAPVSTSRQELAEAVKDLGEQAEKLGNSVVDEESADSALGTDDVPAQAEDVAVAAVEAEAEPVAAAPAVEVTKPRSLFANLKKPVNTPT